MNTRIKLFLSSAVLAACGSAIGQTVINGMLDGQSPTFNRVVEFNSAIQPCILSAVGTNVHYATHTINHPGGDLELRMAMPGGDAYLGLYSAPLNPLSSCLNAIAYNDDSGGLTNSLLNINLPSGTYTVVATTYSNSRTGPYTLTIGRPTPAPHAVPVVGLPALALTSLGLLGAAGFATRRRKDSAKR